MEGDYVVIPLSDPILNTTVGQNCTGLAKHTNKTIGHMIFVFVQLLYVVPSMVYIKFLLVALTCGKHRQIRYSSIFYTLIAMGAWTAVLIHVPHSIFEMIGKRPHLSMMTNLFRFCPTYSALSEPSFGLDLYVYLIQASFVIWDTLRVLGATMIVLYRFHSLLNLTQARKLWESHKTQIILAVIAVPSIIYLPIFAISSRAVIDDEEMIFQNEGLTFFNPEMIHVLISIVCTIVVLVTQIIIVKKKKDQPSSMEMRAPNEEPAQEKESSKFLGDTIDRALNIVGIVEIIAVAVYTLFITARFVRNRFDHSLPPRILYGSLLASDFLSFAPLWAIFFVSAWIREDATPFRSLIMKCCKSRQANQDNEA
ncbi:hypothetical protein PRIPAC_75542 [Pristionchus pacificus]|uniref:Serpentine receptor class gamma n=1 Tax=Pristionchus pacificus TaxID=54126 RepID=A0A454XQL6_PRIPA|nr:hypothetical protein PRIPAC_75542 [Pristionchus pacificus]|eukprot:PDM72046.1 G protein-coupled receptor [Pristionchus pacificus]